MRLSEIHGGSGSHYPLPLSCYTTLLTRVFVRVLEEVNVIQATWALQTSNDLTQIGLNLNWKSEETYSTRKRA